MSAPMQVSMLPAVRLRIVRAGSVAARASAAFFTKRAYHAAVAASASVATAVSSSHREEEPPRPPLVWNARQLREEHDGGVAPPDRPTPPFPTPMKSMTTTTQLSTTHPYHTHRVVLEATTIGTRVRIHRPMPPSYSSTFSVASSAGFYSTIPYLPTRRSSHTNCETGHEERLPNGGGGSPGRPSIADTPLGRPEASSLLRGLDIYEVPAEDGHPLTVYGIGGDEGKMGKKTVLPVLLLHGRTWSSVPVYHLLGGGVSDGKRPSRSLMEALDGGDDGGDDGVLIRPYAVDFRGFGGTPRDDAGYVDPDRCASDALSVLRWLSRKYSDDGQGGGGSCRPALLGWSQGALIAQLVAQRHPEALSKLILYGSIYNPNVIYSHSPLQIPPKDVGSAFTGTTDHEDFPLFGLASSHQNEYDCATEDFIPSPSSSSTSSVANGCGGDGGNGGGGKFPPVPARWFAEAALVSDPIKVQWMNLSQLNECHPSLVKVPTLVVSGDKDPYATLRIQAELFTNLGRGVDRTWSVVANGDHAVHLMDGRDRFAECVAVFLGKKR